MKRRFNNTSSSSEDDYRINEKRGFNEAVDSTTLMQWLLYVQSRPDTFTFSLHVLQKVSEWVSQMFNNWNSCHQKNLTLNNTAEIVSMFYAVGLLFSKTIESIEHSVANKPRNRVVHNIYVPIYRFHCDVVSSCCETLLQIAKLFEKIQKLSLETLYQCSWISDSSHSKDCMSPPHLLDLGSFCRYLNEFLMTYSQPKKQFTDEAHVPKSRETNCLQGDVTAFWNSVLQVAQNASKTLVMFWDLVKTNWACQLALHETKVSPTHFSLQQKTTIFHIFLGIQSLQNFINYTVEQNLAPNNVAQLVSRMYNVYKEISSEDQERRKSEFRARTASVLNCFLLDVVEASMRSCSCEASLFQCHEFFYSPIGNKSLSQIYTVLLCFLHMESIKEPLLHRGHSFYLDFLNFTLLPLWKVQHLARHPMTLSSDSIKTLVNGLLVFVGLQNMLVLGDNFKEDTKNASWRTLKKNISNALWNPVMNITSCLKLHFIYPQTLGISHIILCLNFIGLCTQKMFSKKHITNTTDVSNQVKDSPTNLQHSYYNDFNEQLRWIDEGVSVALYAVFIYITHLLPDLILPCYLRNELHALKLRLLEELVYIGFIKHPYVEFRLTLIWHIENCLNRAA